MTIDRDKLARAIYDAPDDLSGDYIGTVICSSDHLFPAEEHQLGLSTSESYRRATMHVCAQAVTAILTEIEAQGYVLAPKVATEEQWDGLARDIMMWLDMGDKTPRALFKHLERLGREIPQWLYDEMEMHALEHVPSKGTRCCLIYTAMISSIQPPANQEREG